MLFSFLCRRDDVRILFPGRGCAGLEARTSPLRVAEDAEADGPLVFWDGGRKEGGGLPSFSDSDSSRVAADRFRVAKTNLTASSPTNNAYQAYFPLRWPFVTVGEVG